MVEIYIHTFDETMIKAKVLTMPADLTDERHPQILPAIAELTDSLYEVTRN
jgi:hypothetical protein